MELDWLFILELAEAVDVSFMMSERRSSSEDIIDQIYVKLEELFLLKGEAGRRYYRLEEKDLEIK